MKRHRRTLLVTLTSIFVLTCIVLGQQQIGEGPAVTSHMVEADIESGQVSFAQIVGQGRMLFSVMFNRFDGQGRPGSTGDALPRAPIYPAMTRVAGPEAHSCASCHNQPRLGGGGDFSTNVFMMPDSVTPEKDSI